MRRHQGISGLQRKQNVAEEFQKAASNIALFQIEQMKSDLELFKKNLEEFAVKYKKQLENHHFRHQFHQMCASGNFLVSLLIQWESMDLFCCLIFTM